MQRETGVVAPGGLRPESGVSDKARADKRQLIDRGRMEGTAGGSRKAQPWGRVFDQLNPRIFRFPRMAVVIVTATRNQGQGLIVELPLGKRAVVLDRLDVRIRRRQQIGVVFP